MYNFNNLLVSWSYPTKILFGINAVLHLSKFCIEYGIQNPIIVTDSFIAETNVFNQMQSSLKKSEIHTIIFSNIKSNPTSEQLIEGAKLCRSEGCDGVIAIGGGSSLDVGKAIALMQNQKCKWQDLEDIGENYLLADSSTILPVIAIPTTSGTGSEVGRAAVIYDEAQERKVIIFHPKMLPTQVIADPALTFSMPPSLTANTGMDALSHNLEAYCAPSFHPFSDGLAVKGISLVKSSLISAFREPTCTKARSEMLASALLGATAFQKGLGAMHALSHSLGAIYDAHHGLLNAILMPYVLIFNYSEISLKLEQLSYHLGLEQKQNSFVDWVCELREALQIPMSLSDIGIGDEKLEEVVTLSINDPSAGTNPKLMTPEGTRQLFLSALTGKFI